MARRKRKPKMAKMMQCLPRRMADTEADELLAVDNPRSPLTQLRRQVVEHRKWAQDYHNPPENKGA